MTKDYQKAVQNILEISYGIKNKKRCKKKSQINLKEGNNVYPKCGICGKTPEHGIYDGFWVNGKFICSECERELVGSWKEEEYIKALKAVKFVLFG